MDNNKFKEWACSLSGCDGGNPKAETWLCGIESGGNESSYEKNLEYYQVDLVAAIAKGAHIPGSEYDWHDQQRNRYGQSVAKLYAAYRGHRVVEYQKHLDSFGKADLLKLNLYPIAFRHTGDQLWKKYKLDKVTGFKDKELYRIWCFFNRFPEFVDLANEYAPKLIIGTGVSYVIDFFACFAGNRNLSSRIEVGEIKPQSLANKKNRKYYWSKLENGTILAVIPFFSGSNGLNSNYLLEQMGTRLREIVDRGGR